VELGVGSPDGKARITVEAAPTGEVKVIAGAQVHRASIDPEAVSNPPYALTFAGEQGHQGCALVWWEVKPEA
jgi:hypothetical protein